jgi:hypothetical protein
VGGRTAAHSRIYVEVYARSDATRAFAALLSGPSFRGLRPGADHKRQM